MDRSRKMSETEAEIMEVLWESKEPMAASELMEHFAKTQGKVWKAPTLATFLARLGQKGLVESEKRGRVPYYRPLKTREEYSHDLAWEVLDTMYAGSVANFFAALCGDTPLSQEDKRELRAWLEREE